MGRFSTPRTSEHKTRALLVHRCSMLTTGKSQTNYQLGYHSVAGSFNPWPGMPSYGVSYTEYQSRSPTWGGVGVGHIVGQKGPQEESEGVFQRVLRDTPSPQWSAIWQLLSHSQAPNLVWRSAPLTAQPPCSNSLLLPAKWRLRKKDPDPASGPGSAAQDSPPCTC